MPTIPGRSTSEAASGKTARRSGARWTGTTMGLVLAILAMLATVPVLGSSTSSSSGEVAVDLKNVQFSPKEVTITVGDTVKWTNRDGFGHDVTFEDGAKSGDVGGLLQGAEFSRKFDQAGEYRYRCAAHSGDFDSGMIGKVIVKEYAPPPPAGGGGGGQAPAFSLAWLTFETGAILIAAAGAAAFFVQIMRTRGAGKPGGFDIYEIGLLTCVVFILGTLAFMAATATEPVPAEPQAAHGYAMGRWAAVVSIATGALLFIPGSWYALSPPGKEEAEEASG